MAGEPVVVKVPVDVWPSRRDWEATVANIAKMEGKKVYRGEIIAELELEKVVIEVEAPIDGRLSKIYVGVGDKVKPGDPIAEITPE